MKTALIIQHVAFEDLDAFEPVLIQHGYNVQVFHAPTDDFIKIDPIATDLLVVLGGPISVYEANEYPFLHKEADFLQKRLDANLPTLGICLGCQLIAQALGAKVYPAGYKEIGWKPLQLTVAGKMSCLSSLGTEPVLHWHGDTFDLPSGATLLASSDICQHQAFQWGKACLALQFHVEVSKPGLERWFVGHTSELHAAKIDINQLRNITACQADHLQTRGAKLLETWLATL